MWAFEKDIEKVRPSNRPTKLLEIGINKHAWQLHALMKTENNRAVRIAQFCELGKHVEQYKRLIP